MAAPRLSWRKSPPVTSTVHRDPPGLWGRAAGRGRFAVFASISWMGRQGHRAREGPGRARSRSAMGPAGASPGPQPPGARKKIGDTETSRALPAELGNGSEGLQVPKGSGPEKVDIGAGSPPATLGRGTAIAAGEYTRGRISATVGVASLTAVIDG